MFLTTSLYPSWVNVGVEVVVISVSPYISQLVRPTTSVICGVLGCFFITIRTYCAENEVNVNVIHSLYVIVEGKPDGL